MLISINDLIEFENVHGKTMEDGTVYLLINDVARELGFSILEEHKERPINKELWTINGPQYYTFEKIRWSRINQYLAKYGYGPVKSGDIVHEKLIYALAFESSNKIALEFKKKLIDIIIPYFRDNVTKEDYTSLLIKYNSLQGYYNSMINPEHLISTTIIAKTFNISPQVLNKILEHIGLIYKNNGTYALYQRFTNLNLANYKNENGKPTLYWTETGRQFIYNTLQYYNIHPNTDNSNAIHELGKVQIPVVFNPSK